MRRIAVYPFQHFTTRQSLLALSALVLAHPTLLWLHWLEHQQIRPARPVLIRKWHTLPIFKASIYAQCQALRFMLCPHNDKIMLPNEINTSHPYFWNFSSISSRISWTCYRQSPIYATHYWNPVDLMSYSFVNFVAFLVSTERICHICDIIVLTKLTYTQSKRISDFSDWYLGVFALNVGEVLVNFKPLERVWLLTQGMHLRNTPYKRLPAISTGVNSQTNVPDTLYCTKDMCPVKIHWHVKTNYQEYWRVKVTITNRDFSRNFSQWTLTLQHPNFDNFTEAFSFNYKALNPYGTYSSKSHQIAIKRFIFIFWLKIGRLWTRHCCMLHPEAN